MPKVQFTCETCGSVFSVFPAAIRYAIKRGSSIKFCSRACTDAGRSSGIIGTKKRGGEELTCAVCGKGFYRPQSRLRDGRTYLCSEPCRMKAHEAKQIAMGQPRPHLKRGMVINCSVCGTSVYRKKSMIERRISQTCGNRECVSAYSRSLWGLPPLSEAQKRLRKGPSRRATNFTARQRVEWMDTKCAKCGATENLSLDHIIPVCAGGDSSFENAQTLCQPCNIWKSNHEDRKLALAYKQSLLGG